MHEVIDLKLRIYDHYCNIKSIDTVHSSIYTHKFIVSSSAFKHIALKSQYGCRGLMLRSPATRNTDSSQNYEWVVFGNPSWKFGNRACAARPPIAKIKVKAELPTIPFSRNYSDFLC